VELHSLTVPLGAIGTQCSCQLAGGWQEGGAGRSLQPLKKACFSVIRTLHRIVLTLQPKHHFGRPHDLVA